MSEKARKQNTQYLHLALKCFDFNYSFEKQTELVEKCSDFMLEVLATCHFTVKTPLDEPMIVNDCFVNECTIPFEISAYTGDSISDSFFDIQKVFRSSAGIQNAFPRSVKITVRFANERWFSETLLSAHSLVSTKSLFFATIVKHDFFEHWSVRRDTSVIMTNFEYDQQRIICQFFKSEVPRIRDGDGFKKNIKPRISSYSVIVPFKHVQKIFVTEHNQGSFLFHFVLSSPVMVFSTKPGGPETTRARTLRIFNSLEDRETHVCCSPKAITESPVFTVDIISRRKEVYMILSRLYSRMRVPIEFTTVEYSNLTIARGSNPFYNNHALMTREQMIRKASEDFIGRALIEDLSDLEYDRTKCAAPLHDFLVNECVYLIEGLLSRGSLVKCQLLRSKEEWESFRLKVRKNFYLNSYACLDALKEILIYIDENVLLDCLQETFEKLFIKKSEVSKPFELSEDEEKEGYVLLRKVTLTPTRMILMPSEMVMGNRAVRLLVNKSNKYNAFLRISYRDEDGRMLGYYKRNPSAVRNTIMDTFTKGIIITDKKYFYIGASSSQQREHGVYFMLGVLDCDQTKVALHTPEDEMYSIMKFRKKLGRFEALESIPKMMARLGQCFTQSRETEFQIQRKNYYRGRDIIGGSNDKGQPYTFSDGVGTLSWALAEQIAKDLSLNSTPGCFQIRFRGMKGVLSVDCHLDDTANWAREYGIKEIEQSDSISCMFRHSQEKFEAKRYSFQPLEVVKHSGVSSMCLNKPLIAVLDFASETNKTLHDRIRNRINFLLDSNIRQIARQLSSDFHCRQCLRNFPKRINIDYLDERTGLNLFLEPFFRGMLLASSYHSISKQMQKLRISLPNHLARGMLGIMDETGYLQSGQVFFQYTSSCTSYNPTRNCAAIVHTGPVMITKSPTMVLSDLRLFEAVDIPELHHLRDVIVFPQHGPRPHPDEMAGSDLDGDEYSVIWDPELMIEKNVLVQSYASPSPKPVDESTDPSNGTNSIAQDSEADLAAKQNKDCANFFVNVITQDAIGYISNCHLFNADTYHITSSVCQSLAAKAATALDFPKTGIPPEMLTRHWEKDENGKLSRPPESVEYYPDYSNSSVCRPMYASGRWIGELFREVKKIEEYISDQLKEEPAIEIDNLLVEEGWEKYAAGAMSSFNCYLNEIRSIMISYRIRTESELFTGHVRDNSHKMGDKGTDDQSYYNIKQVIDKRVSNTFRKYRFKFFDEFGGYKIYTKSKYRYEETSDVLKRHVTVITPEMKKKASAYYITAYKHAMETGERFLSFGWLLYEINSEIRLTKVIQFPDHLSTTARSTDSLYSIVQNACEGVKTMKHEEFESFVEAIKLDWNIRKYCIKYGDMTDILFALREWANNLKLLDGRFTEKHLMHLFLAFSLNRFPNTLITTDIMIKEIEDSITIPDLIAESMMLKHPHKLLFAFFEFVSSLQFKKLESINFSCTGFHSILIRGEWKPLHEECLKSYYKLLISLKFPILPQGEEDKTSEMIIDAGPFCMLIPENDRDEITSMLQNASGVKEISTRIFQDDILIIMARGTSSAIKKLRDIVVVRVDKYYATKHAESACRPPSTNWVKSEGHALRDYMIRKTMEKLKKC